MNMLTAIIPFLNEGAEIQRTVASIRETAGSEVNILLINDCSEDDTDYKAVAEQYNASYYFNDSRQGVARSRDIGVELCETPYFILFDGHMRFYHNDWWKAVTEALDNNDRAIYCLRCYPLDENFQIKNVKSTGAFINFGENTQKNILDTQWIYTDNTPDMSVIQIPCVLGACYAVSKRYWQYMSGLAGLRSYGCDEAYMSIKTWLEGGKCLLMKNIKVGHIFRKKMPYSLHQPDVVYNRLLIAELLLPMAYKNKVFRELNQTRPESYATAIKTLTEDRNMIMELRTYYRQIFTRDFESFILFNESMK